MNQPPLSDVVQREAHRIARRVPADIELDDLLQVGRIAAWQASERYRPGGVATLETYARPRVRGAMLDMLRKSGIGSRAGYLQRTEIDFDEIASDDDPARDAERRDTRKAAMKSLSPKQRAVAERVLAGVPLRSIAADEGVTTSRVTQRVAEAVQDLAARRPRTPAGFDPEAVLIVRGAPVPPVAKRPPKIRRLMDRMQAGDSCVLSVPTAHSLVAEMKAAGIRSMRRRRSPTTIEVWREPSAEQISASKRRPKT